MLFVSFLIFVEIKNKQICFKHKNVFEFHFDKYFDVLGKVFKVREKELRNYVSQKKKKKK